MAALPGKIVTVSLWSLVTAVIAGWYAFVFVKADDKSALLPGMTTHGHYQIELQCAACHDREETRNIFTTSGVSNAACNKCHAQDLENAGDSHPVRKFKNPENAVFLDHIDALQCVTCHREHNGKTTGGMGVTIPADYCAHCHGMTLENLDSHKDLPFNSCATTGCHNYHDNRALSPSFLLKHFGEPANLPEQVIPAVDTLANWLEESDNPPRAALAKLDADAPGGKSNAADILTAWHETAHAAAGINCSDCHDPGEKWVETPDHTSCAICHEGEVAGFLKGKHGMRLIFPELPPMTPAEARRPMKASAAHEALSCSSCHQPHRYDIQFAARQACVKCHDDDHTKAYSGSAHARLWQAELDGNVPPGTGVSCATCHLPRENNGGHFSANHNQNANLTPNEKMLQNVCLRCHGMQFALDSLSDEKLIRANFSQQPARHHTGLDMAAEAAIARGDNRVIGLRAYLDGISTKPGPTSPEKTK